jgi:hypothetical protein
MKRVSINVFVFTFFLSVTALLPIAGFGQELEYKVLATNKTSTMEKELNQAADAGFRFEAIMGGETGFGGSEAVAIISRPIGKEAKPQYEYKLLATSRTSTMQKELQQAGDAGFIFRDQTVFKSTFGGKEVVSILERDKDARVQHYEYKILATSRTSTMEKELKEAGLAGYQFVGMSVGGTAIGGQEVIAILRRPVKE